LTAAARTAYHRSKPNQTDEEDKRLADTPEPPHADADTSSVETGAGGGGDDSLQDLAREQLELARERLTRELGREPTEDEIDDWLRRQTEGY
jgi:hypothetical protein